MARYIDAEHLFKCETCRHHRSGGCDTWCENGECYSPDMSKIPTADVAEVVRCSECKHLEIINKAPIYAVCKHEKLVFELWEADTRKHSCVDGERKKVE